MFSNSHPPSLSLSLSPTTLTHTINWNWKLWKPLSNNVPVHHITYYYFIKLSYLIPLTTHRTHTHLHTERSLFMFHGCAKIVRLLMLARRTVHTIADRQIGTQAHALTNRPKNTWQKSRKLSSFRFLNFIQPRRFSTFAWRKWYCRTQPTYRRRCEWIVYEHRAC